MKKKAPKPTWYFVVETGLQQLRLTIQAATYKAAIRQVKRKSPNYKIVYP